MSPHLELLILSTFHPLWPPERQRILELAGVVTDWDAFISLAALNQVEPKVFMALTQCGALGALPELPRQHLLSVAARVKEVNEQRLQKARSVFGALQERGIPVCVLKGVLFGETVYAEPGYKRMNDVDFLVRREDIARLPPIYSELGYLPIAERVGRRRDLQLRVSHHLPPYVSVDLRCVLGTQWGLKSPLLGMHIDTGAMWRRACAFDFYGLSLQRLSATDNLFHLCIHLGRFKSGLRDVMDIYNLARAAPMEVDYDLFARLVRDAGAEDLAYHALTLAHRVCPSSDFERVASELAPRVSRFMRETVEKKTRELTVLVRLCSGYLSTIEKAISELNATERAPDKLRRFVALWRHVLVPPPEEARRLCFSPDATGLSNWMVPIQAPISILRALGAEIGFPLLGLLALKMAVDIAVTALNPHAWRTEAASSLGGLSFQDLQRLKDAIY